MAQPYNGVPLGTHILPQPFSFGCFHDQSTASDFHPLALGRIHRDAAHLQALGHRAVAEALIEFAEGPHDPSVVMDLLAQYPRINRAQIVAAGADRPRPYQLVVAP